MTPAKGAKPLKVTRTLLLAWGLALGLFILVRGGLTSVYGLVTVAYLIAMFGCVFNFRVAWIATLTITMLSLVRWLPMVCVNVFMYLTGHELDQDSPATIFVVVVIAVVFVIPPLSINVSLFLERRQFVAVFGKVSEECPVPVVEAESERHPNG